MLSELLSNPKVVGAKQVRRALEAGTVQRVFLASDAESRITDPIARLCERYGVPTETCAPMREIGRACGIAVGAAVAALLDETAPVS